MKVLQHVACPVNTWFAICGRWEFRNELLGLTGRHMGELNILTAPCFKTQNYFLTKKIEKNKNTFPQRNRRKRWEESPAVKKWAPETNYILFWIFTAMIYSFCGKDLFCSAGQKGSSRNLCAAAPAGALAQLYPAQVLDLTAERHRAPFTLSSEQ